VSVADVAPGARMGGVDDSRLRAAAQDRVRRVAPRDQADGAYAGCHNTPLEPRVTGEELLGISPHVGARRRVECIGERLFDHSAGEGPYGKLRNIRAGSGRRHIHLGRASVRRRARWC